MSACAFFLVTPLGCSHYNSHQDPSCVLMFARDGARWRGGGDDVRAASAAAASKRGLVFGYLLRRLSCCAQAINDATIQHYRGSHMDFLLHVLTPDLASFSDFALKALLRMPA